MAGATMMIRGLRPHHVDFVQNSSLTRIGGTEVSDTSA